MAAAPANSNNADFTISLTNYLSTGPVTSTMASCTVSNVAIKGTSTTNQLSGFIVSQFGNMVYQD
jgi:hypothetical protein